MTYRSLALGLVLAACSKSDGGKAADKPETVDPKTSHTTAPSATIDPCDATHLSLADVGGLLTEPITAAKNVGHGACEFATATTDSAGGPSIQVRFDRGIGKLTLRGWRSGDMGSEATTLPNVGDDAVWVAALKEVDVSKAGDLCVASLSGSAVVGRAADDLPARLGAVCTKLFAKL